jgi:membrane-associated phospholipid phosphatase
LRLFEGAVTALGRAFSGWSLLAPALAVALTAVLVATGVDQRLNGLVITRVAMAQDDDRWWIFWLGAAAPTLLGLLLLVGGLVTRDRAAESAGWAILQAVVLVGALTFTLKWLTGRPSPLRAGVDAAEFHLLRSGLGAQARGYFFWPSGHTSSAVAAASAFAAFHGRRRATWAVGLGALAIAASMLAGSFHWVSDILAGALLAWPIGSEIGRGFRERLAALT